MELFPGKQLFLDDFFIESLCDARRVLNRPVKITVEQPLELGFDKPWDRGEIRTGDIVYDEESQRFTLYYSVAVEGGVRVCALTSPDGLDWEYPDLGLVEFAGSKRNNITTFPTDVSRSDCLGVLWDPHAASVAERWKRVDNKPSGSRPGGEVEWRAFHSADGFDWVPYPPGSHSEQTMLFNFGARPNSFGGTIDPDARYIHYFQRGSGRATRALGRRDSPDCLNWSGLRTVLDTDLQDPPGTELYGASCDMANRTEGGLHLLMLHTYSTDLGEPHKMATAGKYWGTEPLGATPIRTDGFIDTQLAVSRDTVSWQRFREPFLPRGEAGAWDWGMLYADAPIRHGDRLMIYYLGANLTHGGRSPVGGEIPFSRAAQRGKGLATLRPDGYVGVEASGYAPGQLTTHRFRQELGGKLRVNVDAAAGELRYELLEDRGTPIPGYSAADCDPIRTDELDAELSWNGKVGWPAIAAEREAFFGKLGRSGSYIKLRFYILPGAKLYSVTLDPPQVTMWRADVTGGVD